MQLLVSKWLFFVWNLSLDLSWHFSPSKYLQLSCKVTRRRVWNENVTKPSLHLNGTHGVTMGRVLRTQNICLFVDCGETKLFSFVSVNSKNHIFCICILVASSTYLFGFNMVMGLQPLLLSYLLFQMRWTHPGLFPMFIVVYLHTFTYAVLLPGTLSLSKSPPNPVVS